jgi:hypothetical protein
MDEPQKRRGFFGTSNLSDIATRKKREPAISPVFLIFYLPSLPVFYH